MIMIKSMNLLHVDGMYKWTRRVANAIGPDWPKLYRALPFVPERIDALRDEDVHKIFMNGKR